MEIKLESVGTIGVGFIFPEEILTQIPCKIGDACAFSSMENGIQLMIYDVESGQLKTAYQAGKIEHISTIFQLGSLGIATSLPQDILQQFDLKIRDIIPLIKMEDCLQLMATRKPKIPRKLILKSKTEQEKRTEQLQEKRWRAEIRRPANSWLRDDDRYLK